MSLIVAYVPGKRFRTGADDSGSASVAGGYWVGETEVTYELWSTVYTWAIADGYAFANAGNMGGGTGDTGQHLVTYINWRDAMIWSNAATEWYNAKSLTSYVCVYTYGGSIVRDSRDGGCNEFVASVQIGASDGRLASVETWDIGFRLARD